MKHEIKVPAMGESITEATVAEILKASGSTVSVDEEVVELETDKVNQVLYAPTAGVVNLTVSVDDVVNIGDVIGFVDANGEAAKTESTAEVSKEESEPTPAQKEVSNPPQEDAPKAVKPAEHSARHTHDQFIGELKAAPEAKAQKVPASTPSPQAAPLPKAPGEKPERRVKMSKIRKVIARRLVEAQQTTAMLTTFNEVDLSAVMAIRQRYKEKFLEQHGAKLGFMSFFVKACVAALQAVPGINAYIEGEELVYREYYDIGIAVGTDRGLVVPVIRGCDQLSFSEVEQSIVDYAKKARSGGLSVDDLVGGGFTITNGGVYGSLLSTPILNPPQSGILGMHKIDKRPVVVDDQIVIRPMMYLALSYDHRVVDGKEAVTFLVHIKNSLEDPSRLLLDV